MGKQRLTITLSESIVKKIDTYIDGVHIRNRSHAIESLLEQSFSPSITTAVLLAGGSKVTNTAKTIPTLKTIGDRSVLSIIFEKLRAIGIKKIVICAGKAADAIRDIYQDGSAYGVSVVYTTEPEDLGTAGALKLAEKHLSTDPFLVIHADILSDLDLESLVAFHLHEASLATIAVKPALGTIDYGHVHLEGNKIFAFLDSSEQRGISIINTGMYVLSPELLKRIKPGKKVFLETDIFPALAKQGELCAFLFQGHWFDVTKDEAYKEASDAWGE